MKQRNNSAHNRSQNSWQRSLPAQSLCWLGSFSLLSGGLVYGQTEPAAIDNIVPTVENSASEAPVKVKFQQNHSVSAPEVARPELEFSQRRSRLRQRLNKGDIAQSANSPQKHETSEPTVFVRKSKPQLEASTPETSENSFKAKVEASVTHKYQKPQVDPTASTNEGSSSANIAQKAKPSSATAENQKDYNNAYIDPTDYGNSAAHKYQAPDSVVITERSSGCRTVLAQGQSVLGSLCAKSPYQNQPLADSNTKLQGKHVPSWLGRSQIAHSVNVTSDKDVSSVETHTSRWNHLGSGITRSSSIASSSVTKSDYRTNRAISNNFISTTTVTDHPAPQGGALSAPLTADNVAPRPSTVAYNIPLSSTLPQIAYSGGLTNGAGGLLFPLPIPAPITSLFGWRIHPITGDRRFHSGTDLGAATGTPILAAYPGTVETADYVGGYGLTVILNHNNAQQTLYGHMSQLLVKPGQVVQQGTVIGLVGSTGNSTGPHLHFEVRNLTPEGWVATDPGVQLESAMNQLVQTLQTAHVTQPTEPQNPPTKRVN